MIYTCVQRICQKPVWSIDHTPLYVASPLVGGTTIQDNQFTDLCSCKL